MSVVFAILLWPVLAAAPQTWSLEAVQAAYERYKMSYAAGAMRDAEEAAEEALELGAEWYGADDARTAALTYNLGDVQRINGDLERANATLALALQRFEKVHGAAALETVDPLMALGETAVAAGDPEADKWFATAVDRARAHGSVGLAGELQDSAGTTWLRAGDRARARPWLERAVATLGSVEGTDALVRTTRSALYALLVAEGDPASAELCPALGIDGLWDEASEVAPIYRTAPVYPPAPLERGVEGDVVVEFRVGPDCRPRQLRVVEATGSLSFRPSAEVAVAEWHFAPQLSDGVPVESVPVRTRVEFRVANVQ